MFWREDLKKQNSWVFRTLCNRDYTSYRCGVVGKKQKSDSMMEYEFIYYFEHGFYFLTWKHIDAIYVVWWGTLCKKYIIVVVVWIEKKLLYICLEFKI